MSTQPSSTAHSPANVDDARLLQLAHDTLDIEANALLGLQKKLSSSFVQAVRAVLKVRGLSLIHI